MDQEKLTAEIARRVTYSGREVEIILRALTEVIGETLKKGEHVKLTNMRRFVVMNPGPESKNPVQTTQERKKTVEFVLSKRFIFPISKETGVFSENGTKDDRSFLKLLSEPLEVPVSVNIHKVKLWNPYVK